MLFDAVFGFYFGFNDNDDSNDDDHHHYHLPTSHHRRRWLSFFKRQTSHFGHFRNSMFHSMDFKDIFSRRALNRD